MLHKAMMNTIILMLFITRAEILYVAHTNVLLRLTVFERTQKHEDYAIVFYVRRCHVFKF